MNRIIIAFVLFGIVISLCTTALIIQKHATDTLVASCDEIIRIYESGDTKQCRAAAEDLSAMFEDTMRLFPFFLGHDRLETIFQQTAALPYLVEDNDPADFMSTVTSIQIHLKVLLDNEWPSPENIL